MRDTVELPEHLGGHASITNMDRGVFDAIVAEHRPESFLDIGCGPGGMVALAGRHGLRARGIDGDWTLDFAGLDVVLHDFTTGPPALDAEYDFGWCVEFLEHVEERFLDNVRPAFQACRRLWVTHAMPGQRGWHHVNCRSAQYWSRIFRAWGFTWNERQNMRLRMRSTMHGKYSRRTGVLITRR